MIALRLILPLIVWVSFPLHGQLPSVVVPPAKPVSAADFNRDRQVDMLDVALLRSALGGDDPIYDLNGDGAVSLLDLFILADEFDRGSLYRARRGTPPAADDPIRLPPDAAYTVSTDVHGLTTVHMEAYDIVVRKGAPFGIVSLRLAGQPIDFAHQQLPLADWEWFTYHRPAYEPLLQRKLLQEIWEGPEAEARADAISLRYRVQNVLRMGVDVEVVFHLRAADTAFDVEYAIHNGASHALQVPYAMVGFPGFSNHRWINKVTAAGAERRPQAPHRNFQSEAAARGLAEYGLLRQHAGINSGDQLHGSISVETPDRTYRLETAFSASEEVGADISFAHINKPSYLTSHLYANDERSRRRSQQVSYRHLPSQRHEGDGSH